MKIGFLLLVIFSFVAMLAADTTISYGAKLGFNLAQHYGTKVDEDDFGVETGMRPGLSAGAWLDLGILPNFTLGYELLYTMKGSREKITIKKMEIDGEIQELSKPAVMNVKYHLDYLELPILLKVKVVDKGTWSFNAITGTAMGLKIKGWHQLDGMVYFPSGDSLYSEIPIFEESRLEEVNMFDYSFIYGSEFKLHSRIPLSVEFRFTLGWDYLALPTYQFFEPAQLRNQTYSLMLGTKF
ncbi:MAG: outer membrane beta-barrel protein [Candidatus Syntrophosphaera sp.]